MILHDKAVAKVNLFLHITAKREDGYHLLESYFAKIDKLYDQVWVEPSDALSVTYNKGNSFDNDIIIKAANVLKEKFGITQGAKFKVEKNIPVAAGLGGGSSNAASALKLLNKLWNLNLSQQQLMEIGLKIGADVPFFIRNENAFVNGIGELIMPMSLHREFYIMLINPKVPSSTVAVFKNFKSKFDQTLQQDNIDLRNTHNILTESACELQPDISKVLEFMSSLSGAHIARMSGTGATCFALFKNEKDCAEAIKQAPQKWWSYSQKLVL